MWKRRVARKKKERKKEERRKKEETSKKQDPAGVTGRVKKKRQDPSKLGGIRLT